MNDTIDGIIHYHQATKHHYQAFARGPGGLDWATQPDPFRRYAGAAVIPLAQVTPGDDPPYAAGFTPGAVTPAPVDFAHVSRLFYDSLALSAWKVYGDSRWALRVNPSSGNLHPTEGYLICGPVPGLCETPLVGHYAPHEHALEVRARPSEQTWADLRAGLPPDTLLVGLTSIHWREAWKYGERAYRYCQLDVGHALAALAIAAAGLGWQAWLLDSPTTDEITALLGVADARGAEPEHPDCLVAISPGGWGEHGWRPSESILADFRRLDWQGQPNLLSPAHVEWPWVEAATEFARKPADHAPRTTQHVAPSPAQKNAPSAVRDAHPAGLALRRIIHQRRSAVEMDGQTYIGRDGFYRILATTLSAPGAPPFSLLPWPPRVHLALFVHRVTGLDPGIYLLARNPAHVAALTAATKPEFAWATPPGCPTELPLYHLAAGNVRGSARRISCGQDIAADGCFSLGMLAQFDGPLHEQGAWIYPRLFWECGMIGQVLYLEAEAAGLRGTGIGCFFDDGMHGLLGLSDAQYQSLYHFTIGGPLDDARLTTLPPYPAA